MSSRENLSTLSLGLAPTALIVDDHAAMRDGLVRLLRTAPTAWGEVVAVGTLGEARRAAARLMPDLVLLDVDLAGDDGLSLLPELASTARVLVLTSHGDAATRERAFRMGAKVLIDKREPADTLLAHIRKLITPDVRGDQAPIAVGA